MPLGSKMDKLISQTQWYGTGNGKPLLNVNRVIKNCEGLVKQSSKLQDTLFKAK